MLTPQLAVSGYHLVNPSFAFPISAQPQAQHGKETQKAKPTTAWDVTFIQQQNFNAVLMVKQRRRETEEKQGQVLRVDKGTNPIIHQHLEETHPQLLLRKSRLSPISPMNTLLLHN